MISDPVRVLHLEGDPRNAVLIRDALERGGLSCDIRIARSREQFNHLIETPCDLVLADCAMPGFDGASALRMFRARHADIPFIFVSATLSEEAAVQCLQEGATDCVLRDHLDRLPNAVRRALREHEERRERQRAEAEIRRLNEEMEHRVSHRTAQLAAANIELQHRQLELDEAKVFLEHLLAASPSMVFRLVPETWSMTYVSPNIGWLLGYSPEEVIGVDEFWQQTIHPDDRPRIVSAVGDAIANVVAQIEQECRCRGKDGRYRWFFTLLRVEYDAESRPVAILGYALDIGDRKTAEEAAQQERAFSDSIIENLPAVVFVKRAPELRYARFNRAAEDMFGLAREDVIGRTDFDLFPPALAQSYVENDRELLQSGRPVEIPEEVIARPGHEPRIVQTKKIPILNSSGEPLYVVGVSIDITAQRAAHEDVRLARLEAERASRAKSDFLSRMSHELRTPLNAILGFAQIMQMDELDVDVDQAEAVDQILRGGMHLLELINEVLDIARIEAGQLSLSPEPVPVADVMAQVAELVRPLGVPRQITITADVASDGSVHVRADRQRLKQALVNLVSNAVKYNRDMGLVRLACERRGDHVRLLVTDTGAGIPLEKRGLLFQPFERLGADQSTIEGTGLGLAVSKGLVEAMGGRIGVDSEIDAGSTFWIELPQTDPPAPRETHVSASTRPAPLGTGSVLYVEDNQSNVRLLERLLSRRPGIRLSTVSTGHAALEQLRRDRPDLILLDLHLPDMSGEEVLRRIWSDPATRTIPVTILSADASVRQQQRVLAAGAVAYLTKPLDIAALLRVIDERLAARSTS